MRASLWTVSIGVWVSFLSINTASARTVINEVMWAGSDQSSSDEWFELFLAPCDENTTGCTPENLGGYTVTYLKSTGIETLMLTFPANFIIQPGEYLVIGNNHESSSRLLSEPALISSSLTLANTGLRLRLKDSSGVVIDEVDDGIGVPFAGANPSAPGAKASMERLDSSVAGTVKENWKTATTSLGLDIGSNMFATPGYANAAAISTSSSTFSSFSTSSFSSSSSVSFESSSSSSFESSQSQSSESSSSVSSSCTSDLLPDISLQSGDFSGTEKVTLNVQAVAIVGTLGGASCHFDFGDGYTSDSCNPPVHSYEKPGTFSLALEVKNQCGTTITQTKNVTVFPSVTHTNSSTGISGSPQVFDDSKIVISGILPNPNAKDVDKEWIELKNFEDYSVPLAGWHLAIGNKTIRRYPIDSVSNIPAHDSVRLYQIETGISLSNSADTVELVNPQGLTVSSVHWEKAEEDRIYQSDAFKDNSLRGTVSSIIDAENLVVSFDSPSSLLIGQNQANVRLIGVNGFDTQGQVELSGYQLQSLDLLRTLTDNKKIELFFDSEVWDSEGNLRAYLMLDDGRILQKELLLSGFAIVDVSHAYASRQEYIDAEKKAVHMKSGIWSVVRIPSSELSSRAQTESKKVTSTVDLRNFYGSGSSSKILITEVFPSPSSKEESGSFLGQEWIEFMSTDASSVSLRGFTLRIGKKTITFGASSILDSRKHIVLLLSQVGLKLKNDGDTIQLYSPEKSLVVTLTYPKTKLGESYAYDEFMESYCMSKSPSPGSDGICASSQNSKAKTTASVTRKKTPKPRASVYEKYAASYRAGLQTVNKQEPIVLASENSGSAQSMLFVFFGILLGSLGSFLVLQVPGVRSFVSN